MFLEQWDYNMFTSIKHTWVICYDFLIFFNNFYIFGKCFKIILRDYFRNISEKLIYNPRGQWKVLLTASGSSDSSGLSWGCSLFCVAVILSIFTLLILPSSVVSLLFVFMFPLASVGSSTCGWVNKSLNVTWSFRSLKTVKYLETECNWTKIYNNL